MHIEGRAERSVRAMELVADTDHELQRRQGAKTLLELMQRNALASLRTELQGLARMLATPRHRLVFIGKVGVGKTTAICHLVGLTTEREKRKKNSKTGTEKVIKATEDLMATGAGFTTLCEVVVMPSEGNRFSIVPYERIEVERTISEFCQAVWKREFPDTEEAGSKSGSQTEQMNFPPELVRAVRNMVKLPEADRRDDDPAIKLARSFSAEGLDRFRARVLSDAKLDDRTQTEFVCQPEELDPKAWIKRTFDDLNLARLDKVSIPRRITLFVDATLLNPQMRGVEAVVDTKGVDATFNREDLDRHIRDDDGAICILTEAFESAPTNVIPLLQRHVTREAPLSLSKFVLMVIPRGSEPEKLVGGSGPVGDRDIGIDRRRGSIEDMMANQGLPKLDHRLVFFDPLLHYEEVSGDNRLREDEADEAKFEREEIWKSIGNAITLRETQIWERVTQISESLKRIREGKGLNPAEEDLVRQAKQRISEYGHITLANADRFLELYRGLWEGPGGRRPATLRATNNRFGDYPHRNINIFYDAVPITEKLVRDAASLPKGKIVEIVRGAAENSPEESDLRELMSVLETRIDTAFEEVVRTVATTMRDFLANDAFFPRDASNKFWVNVQSRYGMGSGYREDVLSMYADQLEDNETVLKDTAADCWRRLLVAPVLEYLG